MNQVILLGAGASIAAGVPGAVDMVQAALSLAKVGIPKRTAWDHMCGDLDASTLEALLAVNRDLEEWCSRQDSGLRVDIELLHNTLLQLATFAESPLQQFVVLKNSPTTASSLNLEHAASFLKKAVVNLATIKSPGLVTYLKPLLKPLTSGSGRLVIVTLNYDNAIELLAASHGIAFDTGMATFWKTGQFSLSDTNLVLLKLHGSVGWKYYRWTDREEIPVDPIFPHIVPQDDYWGGEPAIVFGGTNKLDPNPPFLEIFQAFKAELEQAEHLTIIGYSFRDAHVNTAVMRWLLWDKVRVLRVIDPEAKAGHWFVRAASNPSLGWYYRSYESLLEDHRIILLSKCAEALTEDELW